MTTLSGCPDLTYNPNPHYHFKLFPLESSQSKTEVLPFKTICTYSQIIKEILQHGAGFHSFPQPCIFTAHK